ncbi:hypothetical protein TorRG33x02_187510 [Trema orientale]|uniref:DUF3741 domain-containing protein n=1 Tax=Trema orientale TaxID=63057 RepID=A0A2P5EIV3_TREOI|nr:hypothetical protein TorRG33x02_187510 [Trema orientale]
MKLLSSSSISLSSSSTSFDTRFYKSKSATAGCLAGILRRILCSGTLPTHPSDQTTEETNSVESDSKSREKIQTPGTPGLVARLMGLDSFPEIGSDWAQSRPKNSVSRSRSMNSADRLSGFGDPKKHRRSKSTTSFREMPAFLELENEEFFILSFENVSERREIRSKEAKREMGFGELRQRVGRKGERAENGVGERRVLSDLNGKEMQRRRSSFDKGTSIPTRNSTVKRHVVSDQVASSNGVKRSSNKKKKNSQAVKTVLEPNQCTSEDSSPVSVLDCGQFLIDPEAPISEEVSSSTASSSRRKLSLENENYKSLSPRRNNNLMSEERKTETKQEKHMGSRKKESHSKEEHSEILDEICRLSETELLESSWVQRWDLNNEDFSSIGEELESEIFDQLVEELVNQI